MKRFVTVILLVLTLGGPVRSAPSTEPVLESGAVAWLPEARSNVACVAWHDRVYILGGNGLNGPTATCWSLNPHTRRFEVLPPMPEARAAHGAIVCGDRILVFGGLRESAVQDGIEAFDMHTRTWSHVAAMPFKRARFGLAALDGRVWLAGGSDGASRCADLQAYDPVQGTWTRKANLPEPRDRLALVALGGMLYAIGGETSDGVAARSVWRYAPAEDRWTKASSLAHPRRGCTAVRLGDRIVVAGGTRVVEDEKVFSERLEVYDLQSHDWLPGGPLETPREGCRAVAWRGRMLVIGGVGAETLSSVEETAWRTRASRWTVDPRARVTFGSLDPGPPPAGTTATEEKPLPVPPPLPQTLTLDGAAARALGMPASPDEDARQRLFIEVFDYPRQLAQEVSARRVAAPFLLASLGGWSSVTAMLAAPTAVSVSLAHFAPALTVFDARTPFPRLRVPNETVQGVSPQEWFDRTLRYGIVFVRHVDPPQDDTPAASAAGVAALATETAALLSRAYRTLEGSEPGWTAFIDDSETDQLGTAPHVRLIRVQKSPTVLPGWRDLPLPADPAHLFQSAVLRMICEEREGAQPTILRTVAEMKGSTTRSAVLQVGAVLRVR